MFLQNLNKEVFLFDDAPVDIEDVRNLFSLQIGDDAHLGERPIAIYDDYIVFMGLQMF